jgi:hypothetical protein
MPTITGQIPQGSTGSVLLNYPTGTNDLYYANTLQVERRATGNDRIYASGDIIPTADNTYQLGTTGAAWKEIVMGPGTLQIYGPSNNVATLGADNNGIAYTASGIATPFINVGPTISSTLGAIGGWQVGPTGTAGAPGFDLVARQLIPDGGGGLTGPSYSLLSGTGPTGLTGHGPTGMTGITGATGPAGPLSTQILVVDISNVALTNALIPRSTVQPITLNGLEPNTKYVINWFLNESGTGAGGLNYAEAYLTATNVVGATTTSFRACNSNFPAALAVFDTGGSGGIHRISGSVVDTITTNAGVNSVTFTLYQLASTNYTTNGRFSIQITKSL